jgi:hypothetical protein
MQYKELNFLILQSILKKSANVAINLYMTRFPVFTKIWKRLIHWLTFKLQVTFTHKKIV